MLVLVKSGHGQGYSIQRLTHTSGILERRAGRLSLAGSPSFSISSRACQSLSELFMWFHYVIFLDLVKSR